jgi:hypothetical protein
VPKNAYKAGGDFHREAVSLFRYFNTVLRYERIHRLRDDPERRAAWRAGMSDDIEPSTRLVYHSLTLTGFAPPMGIGARIPFDGMVVLGQGWSATYRSKNTVYVTGDTQAFERDMTFCKMARK